MHTTISEEEEEAGQKRAHTHTHARKTNGQKKVAYQNGTHEKLWKHHLLNPDAAYSSLKERQT